MNNIFLVILILCFLHCKGSSVTMNNNVVNLLDDDFGARITSLGGVSVAIADDNFTYYANPAGLGYATNGFEISVMSARFYSHSFAIRYNWINLNLIGFDAGDIIIREMNQNETRTVRAQEDLIYSIGIGNNLGEKFFYGTNIKYVSSNLIDKHKSDAIISDIGVMYRTSNDIFTIGIVNKNVFKSGLKYNSIYEPLPNDMILGMVYRVPLNYFSLLFGLDYSISKNGLRLGTECNYKYKSVFSCRIGIRTEDYVEFTAGFGIRFDISNNSNNNDIGFNDWQIDYGVNSRIFNLFGFADMLSVSLKINNDIGSRVEYYNAKRMNERAFLWERIQNIEYSINPLTYVDAVAYSGLKLKPLSIERAPVLKSISASAYSGLKLKPLSIERAPVLKSISASNGVEGDKIILKGKYFDKNPSVRFGKVKAEIIEYNSNKIITKVPVMSELGKVSVIVETYNGYSEPKSFFIMSSKPPLLNVKNVKFLDENKNQVLEALETGNLSFVIENNKNTGFAYNVKVKINCDKKGDFTFDDEIFVGDIAPGETKNVNILLRGGYALFDDVVKFKIKVLEGRGYEPVPYEILLKTKKIQEPDLQITDIKIDDGIYPDPKRLCVGNGNNIIELGESVEVKITITNNGIGETKNAKAEIFFDDKGIRILSESRFFDLGNLRTKEKRDIYFAFTVFKDYKGSTKLPFWLNITEDRKIFDKVLPINLTLGEKYQKAVLVKIEGIESSLEVVTTKKLIKKINIAVADFENLDGVSATETTLMAKVFRGELSNIGKFNVVDRENMEKILVEQRFQMSGLTERSRAAVQIGKILNVEKMIIGSCGKFGDKYIITISVIDVESGRIVLSSKSESFLRKDEAMEILKKLAIQVSVQLE